MPATVEEKLEALEETLRGLGGVVVAFSGGVDSALLAYVAHRVLGDRMLAVTAVSPSLLPEEAEECREFCARYGIPFRQVQTRELEDERYARNHPDRCYFCKVELSGRLWEVAQEEGLPHVVYGANADDLLDYRPGHRAARERGVRSPLADVGMTKGEVRELARRFGLPVWDKPAMACLASRLPYGTRVTVEALTQVARAERFLRARGFRQVRVRHHGEIARIEVGAEERLRLLEQADEVTRGLKAAGYTYVTMDLQGYRQGSLNEILGLSNAQEA